ncbi:hypothetical protein BGX38DRAFT_1154363, partial [Terfezia claveryi]
MPESSSQPVLSQVPADNSPTTVSFPNSPQQIQRHPVDTFCQWATSAAQDHSRAQLPPQHFSNSTAFYKECHDFIGSQRRNMEVLHQESDGFGNRTVSIPLENFSNDILEIIKNYDLLPKNNRFGCYSILSSNKPDASGEEVHWFLGSLDSRDEGEQVMRTTIRSIITKVNARPAARDGKI